MWYEILPTYLIMTAAFGMTGVVTFVSKQWYNGTIQGRAQNTYLLRQYWNRDDRIMGRARRVTPGLDGLPLK